jgi:hypothetical protein
VQTASLWPKGIPTRNQANEGEHSPRFVAESHGRRLSSKLVLIPVKRGQRCSTSDRGCPSRMRATFTKHEAIGRSYYA